MLLVFGYYASEAAGGSSYIYPVKALFVYKPYYKYFSIIIMFHHDSNIIICCLCLYITESYPLETVCMYIISSHVITLYTYR